MLWTFARNKPANVVNTDVLGMPCARNTNNNDVYAPPWKVRQTRYMEPKVNPEPSEFHEQEYKLADLWPFKQNGVSVVSLTDA